MLATHASHERLVRFKLPEVRDRRSETGAFLKVTRSMLVSARPTVIEREFDHGAERQRRSQGMLACQRVRDRRQNLITIAIQFVGVREYAFRCAVRRWSVGEERERRTEWVEILCEIERAAFRLDVVELG